jgi:hypothetical protein
MRAPPQAILSGSLPRAASNVPACPIASSRTITRTVAPQYQREHLLPVIPLAIDGVERLRGEAVPAWPGRVTESRGVEYKMKREGRRPPSKASPGFCFPGLLLE